MMSVKNELILFKSIVMRRKMLLPALLLFVFCALCSAQAITKLPKGKLFIIGGGDRTTALMQEMMHTAQLGKNDYIAVLPMSGGEPDTSFFYFVESMKPVCNNAIVNLNFTKTTVNNLQRLDSLKKAKLIFITGGDQARFMKVVLNTPVYDAIHAAYKDGATIAGTSAGAAVMSEQMITGNQLKDTVYKATFSKLVAGNIEFEKGLGLVTTAIIDQHFVVRSRYNRLLSALQAYPGYSCIGIDESTAIIIEGKKVRVAGEGQVLLFANPVNLQVNNKGLLKVKDILLSIFTSGDSFTIK